MGCLFVGQHRTGCSAHHGFRNAAHQQSRFNKGIVLHFDLGRTEEAVKSWESVLALNPNYKTANGMPLQDLIAQVQGQAGESSK